MDVFTIGHSNHTWKTFSGLLEAHGVQVLVDTRTAPVSRWAPFADGRRLPGLLEGKGIRYVFMGKELGGKPDYRLMAQSPSFQRGIEALVGLTSDATVALMCAEEEPAKCHRTRLLGPALARHGVGQVHIRGDSSLQSNEAIQGRTFRKDFQATLFSPGYGSEDVPVTKGWGSQRSDLRYGRGFLSRR